MLPSGSVLSGWANCQSSLVEEDWIFLHDDLKSTNESFRHSQINHEVKRLLLVGLAGKDECSVVLSQMLVLQVRNHLTGDKKVARNLDLPVVHVGGCMIIQIVVNIPTIIKKSSIESLRRKFNEVSNGNT